MMITAKFRSICPVCSSSIAPGSKVEWSKGTKAVHAACAAGASGTSQTASSTATTGATVTRSITAERVGRRTYLRGDTMPVRGLLGLGGCHWDDEARAWWIGSHEAALELMARAATAPAEAAPAKRITHCVGCGCALDRFQVQRGFKFCSSDCVNNRRLGGQSGYVNGRWHQGSDD